MTTPTREQFELVARFVGVTIDPEAWRMYGAPWLPFNDNYFLRAWTPHLPSADACVVMAKVEQWVNTTTPNDVGDYPELDKAVAKYIAAQHSGDANQLCQAAFMLAVAIQEESESEKSN